MNDITRPVLPPVPIAPPPDDPLFVDAIARGFQVLSAFHGASGPLSLGEIAARSGLGKSAVQRIVHTLRHQGYLRRDPRDRGYLPGLRLLDHALDYQRLDPQIARVLPVLMELRRETGERVDFSLRDDLRLVYALRFQSKRGFYSASLIGTSVPLYCTAGGLAVLSRLPRPEAEALLARSSLVPYSQRTLTDPQAIMARVDQARTDGFAIAQEEIVAGEIALGVPVLDEGGQPIGAIHVAGSLSEWDAGSFARSFAPLAMTAAGGLGGG
ncbi:MAG: IclR family transcriptional regulator [Paracoccus sp.]|uniref:IclR family transcriptional regulator n=1 Tax=Paracoccus hibiscisoli TaxID=2023261 RepID=A0A4U0QTV5_9RHOB|nr:IclR family transcriptional regulator [Paracoccus hibiscisoli]MCG6113125.1 IclR family transcriptional regulator [Paracoccus sp. (in: a-proteobacteria)]TJZ85477.1 IclR family transcriptional regulator [Paracoccus hibiscisoli]